MVVSSDMPTVVVGPTMVVVVVVGVVVVVVGKEVVCVGVDDAVGIGIIVVFVDCSLFFVVC